MKKSIGLIILIFIMCAIASLLAYTVISKQNLNKEEFNLKKGEVLKFAKYNTEVKILNIASLESDKKKVIEVSLEVDYNGEVTKYTLKSPSDKSKRIKNSNNYVILDYKDDKISIDVKDKNEI